MKYLKLGTKPDTFYTEEATRTVLSDEPPDIVFQINNTRYLLHKFPLLLKCGLLKRLCSEADSSTSTASTTTTTTTSSPIIILNEFPGDEHSFELCAKFCYGIAITLSAKNFPSAFSAATFLQMTDSVSTPNLLPKLHSFLLSSILPSWKDSVASLASIGHRSTTANNTTTAILIRQLLDSLVSKIFTNPSRVAWSFTYSRPHNSVPKDWWTEDAADLHISHFCSVISAVRSQIPPALVGEALHVYTVKNLPNPDEDRASSTTLRKKSRRALEAIVGMIPAETGAVTGSFLLRLLKIAIGVEASASVKAELIRRAGRQLDEVASAGDLVFLYSVEFGVVEAVVESFLQSGRRNVIGRVAKVFDKSLELVARRDREMKVEKFVGLVKLMPEFAREDHDSLYRAIDTFLQEHPDLSKAEKKQLCRLIDCRKMSGEVRSHAIANEQLPLRTLVQLLFLEQEKAGGGPGGGGGRGSVANNRVVERSGEVLEDEGNKREGSRSKPRTKSREEERRGSKHE